MGSRTSCGCYAYSIKTKPHNEALFHPSSVKPLYSFVRGFSLIKTEKIIFMIMKLKEEYAHLKVSCPLTGRQVWLQEVDKRLWNLYSKSYPQYFTNEIKKDDKPSSRTK